MLLHCDANCVATLLRNGATLMLVIVTVVCIYVSLTQIITKLALLIKLDSVFWIGLLWRVRCALYSSYCYAEICSSRLSVQQVCTVSVGVIWSDHVSYVTNILAVRIGNIAGVWLLVIRSRMGAIRSVQICFFIIKPTRCTNFTNLFCHEILHVLDSSSAHHQEFIHCTLSNGICHTGL